MHSFIRSLYCLGGGGGSTLAAAFAFFASSSLATAAFAQPATAVSVAAAPLFASGVHLHASLHDAD